MEHAERIRSSFERIRRTSPLVTSRFYGILFERHPHLRSLFRDPESQAEMLMEMLVSIVDHLDDAPWLQTTLAGLGARHVEYGVSAEMYPLVGECLLAALAEAAGDAWDDALEAAWRRAYEEISAHMLRGARVLTH